MVSEKQEMFEYRVHIKGIWGRNRSVKTQSVLLQTVAEKVAQEQMLPTVQAKLAELKVKPGSAYALIEQPVTIEKHVTDGHEWTSRSFMMFSHTVLAQGTV